MRRRQRNVQDSVVQSCCFAYLTKSSWLSLLFLTSSLPSPSSLLKLDSLSLSIRVNDSESLKTNALKLSVIWLKRRNSKTIPWLVGANDFSPGLYLREGRILIFFPSKSAYYYLALSRAQRSLSHTQLIKISWSFVFSVTAIQNYGNFQTIFIV